MKNFFMKKKSIIACFLLVMLVVLEITPGVAAHAAAEDYTVKVTLGYEGRQEVSVHVPVTIEITSIKSDFDGSVQVTVPGRNGNIMYEQPLSLAKRTTKKVQMAPMFYISGSEIYIALVNKKGKVVYADYAITNVTTNRNYVKVGILSDDYAVTRLFDNKSFNSSYFSELRLNAVELKIEDIYENCEAMDSLDVIVVSNFSTDLLTDKQVKAIEGWVNNGGLLFIGTGDSYKKTMEGLKSFINFKDNGLIDVKTDFAGEEVFNISGSSIYNKYTKRDVLEFMGDHRWELQDLINDIDQVIYSVLCLDISNEVKSGETMDLSKYFSKIWENDGWRSMSDMFYYTDCWISDEHHYYDNFKEMHYDGMSTGIYDINYLLFQDFCKQVVFNAIIANYIEEQLHESADPYIIFSEPENNIGGYESFDYSVVDATIWDFDFSDIKIAGTDRRTNEEIDIFEIKKQGKGNIVMAAMDFSKNPFVTYRNGDKILTKIIEDLIGSDMLMRMKNYDPNPWGWGYNQKNEDYASLMEKLTANKTVPVAVYFLVFALYIAGCFILFSVLKKKKKSLLLWPLIGAAALVTSVLVFLLSFSTRASKPVINMVRVVDAADKSGVVDGYAGITLPKNKEYKILFNEGLTSKYLDVRSGYYYESEPLNTYSVAFTEQDGKSGIIFNNSTILSKKNMIITEDNFEHGDIDFTGMYLGGNKRGSITNNYGYDLYDCCIILDSCVISIGTLKNGETIDIAALPARGTLDNSYRLSSREILREAVFGKTNTADRVMGFNNKNIVRDNTRYNAIEYVADITGIEVLAYYWGNNVPVGPGPDYLPQITTDRMVFIGFNNRTQSVTDSDVTEVITEVVYKEANR